MTLALHHFFVFTTKNAPVVDELHQLGFIEGSRNTHHGQGTANRRVFFENCMLEFIWVESEDEIQSLTTSPTRLWERSRHEATGFSPFGFALCPLNANRISEPPFPGWAYKPVYLPAGYKIWMACQDNQPWEPGVFFLDFCQPIDSSIHEPTNHPNGATRISRIAVTINAPSNKLSQAAGCLADAGIELIQGMTPNVEVTLLASQINTFKLKASPVQFKLQKQ